MKLLVNFGCVALVVALGWIGFKYQPRPTVTDTRYSLEIVASYSYTTVYTLRDNETREEWLAVSGVGMVKR
jgi:hypothetical protein